MKTILLFTLNLFCALVLHAQNIKISDPGNLQEKIMEADSVIITSHKSLRINALRNRMPVVLSRTIVIDGKINDSLILERIVLDKRGRKQLLSLLEKDYLSNIPPEVLMCSFDPHHAVFIYKGGLLSYIDFCLHCQQYEQTADVKSKLVLEHNTWKKLSAYFKNKGILKGQYQNENFRKEVNIE